MLADYQQLFKLRMVRERKATTLHAQLIKDDLDYMQLMTHTNKESPTLIGHI